MGDYEPWRPHHHRRAGIPRKWQYVGLAVLSAITVAAVVAVLLLT